MTISTEAPSGAADAGEGYELLGVLIMAHALGDPDLAIDEIRRFDRSSDVVQSNSVTFRRPDGDVVVRADVRGGCTTFHPTAMLFDRILPESVIVTLPGNGLGAVLGTWLNHPDLVVDTAVTQPDGSTTLALRPTALTAEQAMAAIRHMREELMADAGTEDR